MKRLYTALIAAIIAIGAAAQEETVSITLNWDLPGAINVRVGRNDVEIPADATTITLTYPKSDWPSATITAGTNRILESCTYLDDNGNTRSVALKNNSFSISMTSTTYTGRTFTITTSELVRDASVTVNIENGVEKIESLMLAGTGEVLTPVNAGENVYTFNSTLDTQMYITPKTGTEIYKVTLNGTEVTRRSWENYFRVNIANGDVIVVRVYENDEDAPKPCAVTVELPEGCEDCITNFFNSSLLEILKLENNTFVVEEGNRVRLTFSDEYDITKVTFEGEDLGYSSESTQLTFTVNTSGTLKVEASPKAYGTVTYTAYIVAGEGVEIWAGNHLNGYVVDPGEGEAVTEDIVLPQSDVDGAWTIPAADVRKYTFEVSSKYTYINYYVTDGYWLRTARCEDTAVFASNPVTSTTLYVVAEKIEADTNIIVYYAGEPANVRFSAGALTEGYNYVSFDYDYMSPLTVAPLSDVNNPTVVVDGNAITPDAYSQFVINPGNESVVKIFFDGTTHRASDVTCTIAEDAYAIVCYDKIVFWEDFSEPLKCYDGTEFQILPDDDCEVYIDGVLGEYDEDGICTFVTTGSHAIEVKKLGGISAIEDDTTEGVVEYYNLQGMRVSNPAAGNIYIRRCGTTATKVRL